jgi:hypothetical protein
LGLWHYSQLYNGQVAALHGALSSVMWPTCDGLAEQRARTETHLIEIALQVRANQPADFAGEADRCPLRNSCNIANTAVGWKEPLTGSLRSASALRCVRPSSGPYVPLDSPAFIDVLITNHWSLWRNFASAILISHEFTLCQSVNFACDRIAA